MKKILVIDNDVFSLRLVYRILSPEYEVYQLESGKNVREYLSGQPVDLILLDYHMPEMNGKEVLKELKENQETAKIPIVILTGEQEPAVEVDCFREGAEDFITKPFVPEVVRSRLRRILELNHLKSSLQERLNEKSRQVENVVLQAITTVANTVDAKDDYTGEHSIRVASYAAMIARELGWTEEEIRNIHYLGLLHDIGKISVPDAIIRKPSALSEDEWRIMQGHTTTGSEILKDIQVVKQAAEVALSHHERYDGTGYPEGAKGEQIPIEARIIGIADAYDAMTSNRVYRKHLTQEQVIREFTREKGKQFDPYLVDVFLKMLMEEKLDGREGEFNYQQELSAAEESNRLLYKVMEADIHRVRRESMRDSLTGLYNRSYAEKQISNYLLKRPVGTYFMIDLDNLKHVNDHYGHIAGDSSLKCIADILISAGGEDGLTCRLGGDEFTLFFFNEMSREEIERIAADIRERYYDISHRTEYMQGTSISIGIAVAGVDGESYQELYNAADKALYLSKRRGKNCSSFFEDSKEDTGTDHRMVVDIHKLEQLMQERKCAPGIYQVEYTEFQRIYNFVSRCVERTGQNAELLLISLHSRHAQWDFPEALEMEMENMEKAIIQSLRRNDVCTRYSSSQLLLVLVDISEKDTDSVVNRIRRHYHAIQNYPQYEMSVEQTKIEGIMPAKPKGADTGSLLFSG